MIISLLFLVGKEFNTLLIDLLVSPDLNATGCYVSPSTSPNMINRKNKPSALCTIRPNQALRKRLLG